MIDHNAYRRALLAEPRNDGAELREHREACAECSDYRERLLRFESRLQRALTLDMSETKPTRRPNWLALAASVLVALVVAGAAWLASPRAALAAALVEHVMGEPQSWSAQAPVADQKLAGVLRDAHLHLSAAAGTVSYASSCEFRGHVVPHLVVQSASGPATVMVLVNEHPSKQVQFDEKGYRGVIMPIAGHGGIALLMRSSDAQVHDVEAVVTQVRRALVWEP
jgi:hypothetical protein